MPDDNLQKQINDLIDVPFGSAQKDEEEFLKEEDGSFGDKPILANKADSSYVDKAKTDNNYPNDKQAEAGRVETKTKIEETKSKPPYERVEDGELDSNKERKEGLLKDVAPEEKQERLKEKIKEMELARKEDEVKNKAAAQGFGYINLKGLPIIPEALKLIPESDSKEKGIICFMYKKGIGARVAILENNGEIQEIIKRLSDEHGSIPVKVYLTSKASMDGGLKMYAALPKVIENVDDIQILESDLEKSVGELKDLKDLAGKIKEINITQLLSLILAAAIKVEATDIHIEAEEAGINLRFRIDGVLHDIAKLDRQEWDKLISRIKLSSKLKINIKDKPQDGNFTIHIKRDVIDFRVSTLPTAFGESVVMRILYHEKVKSMALDKLGIEQYAMKIIEKEIIKPNGMIVITGPTGSGKTTTLYAVINRLNTPDNKIITIEDPVEYKIEGINQSQVNKDKGYTFAKALRSVVRQDPDIVLVGEIRDKETAEISLNAALTGHLLFATLHTNDAAGTVARFLALGAKPYLLAPALNMALAQRLVRKICEHCKEEIVLGETEKEKVKTELNSLPEQYKNLVPEDIGNLKFYKGKGCKECAGLGYKGQIGIFEIFQITDEVRDMILSNNVSEHRMKEIGISNGMVTMRQDGLLKAVKGITSVDEVFRVS